MTNKWRRKILLSGFISTALFTGSGDLHTGIQMFQQAPVSAATLTYTTTDYLNVRTGPSISFSILGTVKKGSVLAVTGRTGNGWYTIEYNGKKGFVSGQYVKASSVPDQISVNYITTADLNIRTGNSVAYPIIGVLKKGSSVNVQAKLSNGWYQITWNRKKGYVSGNYVKPAIESNRITMNVPLVLQNPELPAGCEVTSLDMALLYKGVHVDKVTLARKVTYTNTLDPNKGYVGSPFNGTGYTINPVKLQELAKFYRPGSSDLTGSSILTIENEIRKGNPVLVWYTIGYGDVRNENHYIYQNGRKYWWPQPLHCIVVTGVSQTDFYINDPLNGNKNYPIKKSRFNQVYTEMGNRALVVR